MAVRVLLFLAGLAVGGGVVYGLHNQNLIGEQEGAEPAAFSEVDESLAGVLAERFRPWLRFDDRERWRPLNVSRLLEERAGRKAAHRFCQRVSESPSCRGIANEPDFRRQARAASALGERTFIDLAGGSLNDYRSPRRCGTLADCGTGAGSAIYYHVTQSNDRYYVDYWWFMRFNNFYRSRPRASCRRAKLREAGVCGEHEGDWEGVTVVTPQGDDQQLDYVVYAAHDATFRYAAEELQLHGGTRPDVYVARGSHASYPRACAKGCRQPITIEGLVTLPESSSDGRDDWERNEDDCKADAAGSCLLSLPRTDRDPHAWTVWPGRWGAGCGDVCRGEPGPNSPSAPGLQTRYQTPWCSTQRSVLTCDGFALGCSDWLGPLVAAVACNPDVLADGLGDPEAKRAGRLTVTVKGEARNVETTPGVVQALGAPLTPGETVTLTGASADVQLLVRARQGRFVVEARFDKLDLQERGKVVVVVGEGAEGPVLRAGDRKPVERRVLEIDPTPTVQELGGG